MRSFRLTLSYDGTDFSGWQRQPDQRTVQGELERAWKAVTGERATLFASGRTDAGVHAIGQMVSVASNTQLTAYRMRAALNAHLPDDVSVREVFDARPGFHALRDTLRKRYRYVIQDGWQLDPLSRRFAWHVKHPLDANAMHRAGQHLVGTHDFDSFESTGSQRLSSRRTINDVVVERRETDIGERVVIEVEADGFLYNMVRNITGTLVAVGRGKRSEQWVADVLAAHDRREAGVAAPPHGLFLLRVYVSEDANYVSPDLASDLPAGDLPTADESVANATDANSSSTAES